MWCDHSKEKEMSACKKIMLNSSHSKGQDYLSFVSPFDVCLSLMFFLVFVDSCCKDMLSKSTLSDWFSCFYSQKSYWTWFKRLWVILQSQSFRPHELSTLRNSFIEKGGETTIQDELTGRAGLWHQTYLTITFSKCLTITFSKSKEVGRTGSKTPLASK